MLAFLSAYRWLLGGVAALALLASGAYGVWHVYSKGEAAGAAQVTEQVQTNTITIQREIHRAEDRGPRTPRDVSRRLRDGTF